LFSFIFSHRAKEGEEEDENVDHQEREERLREKRVKN